MCQAAPPEARSSSPRAPPASAMAAADSAFTPLLLSTRRPHTRATPGLGALAARPLAVCTPLYCTRTCNPLTQALSTRAAHKMRLCSPGWSVTNEACQKALTARLPIWTVCDISNTLVTMRHVDAQHVLTST